MTKESSEKYEVVPIVAESDSAQIVAATVEPIPAASRRSFVLRSAVALTTIVGIALLICSCLGHMENGGMRGIEHDSFGNRGHGQYGYGYHHHHDGEEGPRHHHDGEGHHHYHDNKGHHHHHDDEEGPHHHHRPEEGPHHHHHEKDRNHYHNDNEEPHPHVQSPPPPPLSPEEQADKSHHVKPPAGEAKSGLFPFIPPPPLHHEEDHPDELKDWEFEDWEIDGGHHHESPSDSSSTDLPDVVNDKGEILKETIPEIGEINDDDW